MSRVSGEERTKSVRIVRSNKTFVSKLTESKLSQFVTKSAPNMFYSKMTAISS